MLHDKIINDRYSITRGLSEVVDLTKEIHVKSRAKRRAETVDIAAAAAVAETALGKKQNLLRMLSLNLQLLVAPPLLRSCSRPIGTALRQKSCSLVTQVMTEAL